MYWMTFDLSNIHCNGYSDECDKVCSKKEFYHTYINNDNKLQCMYIFMYTVELKFVWIWCKCYLKSILHVIISQPLALDNSITTTYLHLTVFWYTSFLSLIDLAY